MPAARKVLPSLSHAVKAHVTKSHTLWGNQCLSQLKKVISQLTHICRAGYTVWKLLVAKALAQAAAQAAGSMCISLQNELLHCFVLIPTEINHLSQTPDYFTESYKPHQGCCELNFPDFPFSCPNPLSMQIANPTRKSRLLTEQSTVLWQQWLLTQSLSNSQAEKIQKARRCISSTGTAPCPPEDHGWSFTKALESTNNVRHTHRRSFYVNITHKVLK